MEKQNECSSNVRVNFEPTHADERYFVADVKAQRVNVGVSWNDPIIASMCALHASYYSNVCESARVRLGMCVFLCLFLSSLRTQTSGTLLRT